MTERPDPSPSSRALRDDARDLVDQPTADLQGGRPSGTGGEVPAQPHHETPADQPHHETPTAQPRHRSLHFETDTNAQPNHRSLHFETGASALLSTRDARPPQEQDTKEKAAGIVSKGGARLDATSALMLAITSVIAAMAFFWPFFVVPSASLDGNSLSPFVFVLLLPVVIGIVVSQLSRGMIDPKLLAMLGVLTALGTLDRPLGAGTAGIEFTFIPLILGGRVFGPVFGFLLGSTTLLTSAMLTGGVGPWLPFQMLAASFVSMGAGLLPRAKGWWEIVLLAVYGSISTTLYGWLVDLSFWPFNVGLATELSYVAGAPILENLHRFMLFNLATSMAWNIGRAITTIITLTLIGKPLLRILRRTNRKATFAPG